MIISWHSSDRGAVRRLPLRPQLSITTEPESRLSEKGKDSDSEWEG